MPLNILSPGWVAAAEHRLAAAAAVGTRQHIVAAKQISSFWST